ncbi:MAG: GNAT family N-acetyltransferase [Proteobacteria bacterium]|nr:GNAT family N-acetyltransferase [Pseudomonadota bacterium]
MLADAITIRIATENDLPSLDAMNEALGKGAGDPWFSMCLAEQTEGRSHLFIAAVADRHDAGYCALNMNSPYEFFRKLRALEIQNLNVIPVLRRRGIGAALVRHCEMAACAAGYEYIGLGVGLDKGYGAAQRLYARLGYVPDGNGIVYDYSAVRRGEVRPVDDQLNLMMIKGLSHTEA